MRSLLVIFLVVAVFSAVVFLGTGFLFERRTSGCGRAETVVSTGSSMTPVLAAGQNLTVLKNYYGCHNVSVGDVVVYNWTGNQVPVVKFVRAVPGDSLRFDKCYLRRNNKLVKNSEGSPYCFSGKRKQMLKLYTDDSISGYLLLGNQVSGTLDSTRFGLVDKEHILGKAMN